MSIKITFKPDFKRRTYTKDNIGIGYRPITDPDQEWDPRYVYIYGNLGIKINDRRLPRMGYFGDDMVDFWAWIEELSLMLIDFDNGENAYVYDLADQGEPAFKFVRDDDTVKVSITESDLAGNGEPDPEWQGVPFSLRELQEEYLKFRRTFLEELGRQRSDMVEYWTRVFGWPDHKDDLSRNWAAFNLEAIVRLRSPREDTLLISEELTEIDRGEALEKDYFYIPVICYASPGVTLRRDWYSLRFNKNEPPNSLTVYASKVPMGKTLRQAVASDLEKDFNYPHDKVFSIIQRVKTYDTARNKYGKELTRVLVIVDVFERFDVANIHPLGMQLSWCEEGESDSNPVGKYFESDKAAHMETVKISSGSYVPVKERLKAGRDRLDPSLMADIRSGRTKNIMQLWSAFTGWLDATLPEQAVLLNPPATVNDFEEFTRAVGYELPEDLKRLYRINNGGALGNSILSLEFMSIAAVISDWKVWREVEREDGGPDVDEPTYPNGAIKRTYTNPKWIPLLTDGGGNNIGIDLDPGETGVVGQIINFGRDEYSKFVIANNLEDFFELILLQIADENVTIAAFPDLITDAEDVSWGIGEFVLTDGLREIIIPK